jgi:CheY-like chemotaxis protein
VTASRGRILVVDDEAAIVEVLAEYLGSRGYAVRSTADGREALAAVARERPDLVLLDLRMPGMSGLEVLARLREVAPGVPVIMLTATVDVAPAKEALRLGAFGYVTKPFDFQQLGPVIEGAIKGAGESR